MAKRRPSGDGMVRKRADGRWEGRIVVGHKENGTPIFRYVSARTQKALLEKLHKNMDEYDGAELNENSRKRKYRLALTGRASVKKTRVSLSVKLKKIFT